MQPNIVINMARKKTYADWERDVTYIPPPPQPPQIYINSYPVNQPSYYSYQQFTPTYRSNLPVYKIKNLNYSIIFCNYIYIYK